MTFYIECVIMVLGLRYIKGFKMTNEEVYKFKVDYIWHKEVDYRRKWGKFPSVKETRKWIKQARKEVQKLEL